MSEKIACALCGALVHVMQNHLRDAHPEVTVADYQERFPEAPMLSDMAKAKIAEKKAAAAIPAPARAASDPTTVGLIVKKPMHELFGFVNGGSAVPAALNKRGQPINVSTMTVEPELEAFVPEIDEKYIFDIELTKTIIMGLELNMPIYLWGMHGTGKTTAGEQVSARLGRPLIRVGHTVNTEESHIVGQMAVRDGATVFDFGPLPFAMINGLTYLADEYDCAVPSVLMVYQSVLEGKPLVIKEAPAHQRIIKPHPNFRFIGTGNTNGGGDETGLYQGTQLQNAANYSRFGIVEEVHYPPEKQEALIIASQTSIPDSDAKKIVDFAKSVREARAANRITSTISTRELIYAAMIGRARGSEWRIGLQKAFTNRLNRIDREVVDQFAQRVFG
jgi:cobaltochelatase CobS